MQKTILITGSTDGIGLETAKALYSQGHQVLLHGRNPSKLEMAEKALLALPGRGRVESYLADLSSMAEVEGLAQAIGESHSQIDVLINNAGILRTADTITNDGMDIRFAVNTFAPYILTQRLLPLLGPDARVVNLSSAAQSPVNLEALAGHTRITDDLNAYAQSKLALTIWSSSMAHSQGDKGPVIVAINPGSLLATKMVKEGFGMAGKDINIGRDILIRAALSDEFTDASGKYFDNDAGRFASPHPDALDAMKSEKVVRAIEAVLANRRH
ncbi:MAG: oxidoreductase [gamma proteobacterium symbiont of Ctena orbiculata]|nr:MAG: oxidoreductase [gamma proteobacterium symbiont of Ctena orbiculata]PVV27483.1 MAG: oxidoreductase [gamma proteobacterium symbiont of Ctena orbiculata]